MAWYSTNWKYRKDCIITGTTDGAKTNYQLKFTVYKGTGTDSGFTVYCQGNCNDDFSDIRFAKSDATSLLDYWIEDYTSGTVATIWVEVDSIPISPSQTKLYLYYGYASATTASNGTDTFILFDHFTTLTPVSGTIWGLSTPPPSIVDSTWVQFNSSEGLLSLSSVVPANTPCSIEMKLYAVDVDTDGGYTSGQYPVLVADTTGDYDGIQWYYEGAYDRYVYANDVAAWKAGTSKGLTNGITVRQSWRFTSGGQRHVVSGDLTIDDTFTEDTSMADGYAYKVQLGYPNAMFTQDVRLDWIIIRQYVSVEGTAEPTASDWSPQATGETTGYVSYLRF